MYLVMIDALGGVVPGEDSVFRVQASKSNEVLLLGNIDRLLVHTRGDANQDSAMIAERHSVNGFLHSAEIAAPILRHADHFGLHPASLDLGGFSSPSPSPVDWI